MLLCLGSTPRAPGFIATVRRLGLKWTGKVVPRPCEVNDPSQEPYGLVALTKADHGGHVCARIEALPS